MNGIYANELVKQKLSGPSDFMQELINVSLAEESLERKFSRM